MPLSIFLWAICVLLVICWIIGVLVHFGGMLIHLILVAALVILAYHFITDHHFD